ncbi:hypothetical protein SMICM304S_05533 [Streptomyces microflavus]
MVQGGNDPFGRPEEFLPGPYQLARCRTATTASPYRRQSGLAHPVLPRALGRPPGARARRADDGRALAQLVRALLSGALRPAADVHLRSWVFAQCHREDTAHRATIRALVQAVDIKDTYTRGHSERVGRASVLIARELGMDPGRLEALRFAGILHDVGKLGVPTRVLRKDGPLTPDERRVMELHPEYGHEIVRSIGFLDEARAAILHHHERLDGTGYPYGLSGASIPSPPGSSRSPTPSTP